VVITVLQKQSSKNRENHEEELRRNHADRHESKELSHETHWLTSKEIDYLLLYAVSKLKQVGEEEISSIYYTIL
jgi:hypothetical protein